MSAQLSSSVYALGAMAALSARSGLHRDYTVADMERLFGPPLAADQVRVFMASEYPRSFLSPRMDWPVGFVTWALMDRDSEDAYVSQSRLLSPIDFTSGAEVWVIDLVAPYGGVRGIVRDMRRELSLRYPNRYAHWIRNNMTAERRLGRGERGSARAES
jgi:cytolysin-activating lysine-acyltransferase